MKISRTEHVRNRQKTAHSVINGWQSGWQCRRDPQRSICWFRGSPQGNQVPGFRQGQAPAIRLPSHLGGDRGYVPAHRRRHPASLKIPFDLGAVDSDGDRSRRGPEVGAGTLGFDRVGGLQRAGKAGDRSTPPADTTPDDLERARLAPEPTTFPVDGESGPGWSDRGDGPSRLLGAGAGVIRDHTDEAAKIGPVREAGGGLPPRGVNRKPGAGHRPITVAAVREVLGGSDRSRPSPRAGHDRGPRSSKFGLHDDPDRRGRDTAGQCGTLRFAPPLDRVIVNGNWVTGRRLSHRAGPIRWASAPCTRREPPRSGS